MCWTSQRARPNSYRCMQRPSTRACRCAVLAKPSVRRPHRLRRGRRLMGVRSLCWVGSCPTCCGAAARCRASAPPAVGGILREATGLQERVPPHADRVLTPSTPIRAPLPRVGRPWRASASVASLALAQHSPLRQCGAPSTTAPPEAPAAAPALFFPCCAAGGGTPMEPARRLTRRPLACMALARRGCWPPAA